MLSKTAFFILGIIGDNPINPYAISKLINSKRKHVGRYLHPQTIYSVIKSLHKKRLVSLKRMKNGKMPDLNVYTITEKGKKVLRDHLISFLSAPEDPLSELSLAVYTMGHLDRDVVIGALREYQKKTEQEIAAREALIKSDAAEHNLSGANLVAIEHLLHISQVNLDTVTRLIEKVEAEPRWSTSPIPFWRDEIS